MMGGKQRGSEYRTGRNETLANILHFRVHFVQLYANAYSCTMNDQALYFVFSSSQSCTRQCILPDSVGGVTEVVSGLGVTNVSRVAAVAVSLVDVVSVVTVDMVDMGAWGD